MFRRPRRLLGILLLLAVWEITAQLALLPARYFPAVTDLPGAIARMAVSGEIWSAEVLTIGRVFGGLTLACLAAVALAIATTWSRFIHNLLSPLIELVRPLPPAALIPIMIFILGLGTSLFMFVIAFAAIWPIYLSTENALRSVDHRLLDTARSFGCRSWETLWCVKLPAALPEIFTGLRVGAGVAFIATVVVEMLAGRGGLGYLLFDTAYSNRTSETYAVLLIAGLDGVLINFVFLGLQRVLVGWQLTRWSQTEQGEAA